MAVSGLGVAYAASGFVLLWSGVKNATLKDTLTSFLKGQAPTANPTGAPTIGVADSSSSGASGGSSQGSASSAAASAPAVDKSGTPGANVALGQLMAAAYGWTGNNWLCLKTGWQEESGWSQYAANVPSDPYEHAYGIPQANPGTKMASAGSDWEDNPVTQIKWGLSYIKATYGSPSQVPGWTPDGPSAGYVGY
jgi:hypothetical protein